MSQLRSFYMLLDEFGSQYATSSLALSILKQPDSASSAPDNPPLDAESPQNLSRRPWPSSSRMI
jgi:hypothetical protein